MMICEDDGTRLDCKDTRSRKNSSSTTRTYQCPVCQKRYTTLEIFVDRPGRGNTALRQLQAKVTILNKEISAAMDKFNQSLGEKP